MRNNKVTGFQLHPRGNRICALGAFGIVQATAETLATLRKHPGPPGGLPIPANLLNHAEDQTVLALAAVLHAIHDFQLQEQDFTDWAVVGAPRFPGRTSFAKSLDKFHSQGSLSVSPLIIPFLSTHAVSSLLSLALHIQGTSLGVGGGSDGFVQALLMGLSLQQENDLPGVWVVLTGWDPELVPESEATTGPQPICQAVALALLPDAASTHGSHLRMVSRAREQAASPNLPDLVRYLAGASTTNPTGRWGCPIDGNLCLELTVENLRQVVSPLARSA